MKSSIAAVHCEQWDLDEDSFTIVNETVYCSREYSARLLDAARYSGFVQNAEYRVTLKNLERNVITP